jgi:hypothetical protein
LVPDPISLPGNLVRYLQNHPWRIPWNRIDWLDGLPWPPTSACWPASRYWEDVHYQYRVGLYDEIEFSRQRGAWQAFFANSNRAVEYWCQVRLLYSPKFSSEIDSLLPEGSC